MSVNRNELKNIGFKVVGVERQNQPWDTGGLINQKMPPGWFIILDPPVIAIDDHSAIDLVALVIKPNGEKIKMKYDLYQLRENGQLCLFFSDIEFKQIEVGNIIELQDA